MASGFVPLPRPELLLLCLPKEEVTKRHLVFRAPSAGGVASIGWAMTWRTPSSLKWLITKRSRLSGALLRLDEQRARLLNDLAVVESEAAPLRRALAALDQTFRLHDIQMEPADIHPVRPHRRERLMPPGQLGLAILGELRQASGWLTGAEVLERIAHRINPRETDYDEVRKCIRRRMGRLARQGILERQAHITANGANGDTLWRIADRRSSAVKSVLQPANEIVDAQFTATAPTLPVAGPPLGHGGSHQASQD